MKYLFILSESFPLLTAQEIYLTDDNYYTENGFVLKLSRYEFEKTSETLRNKLS